MQNKNSLQPLVDVMEKLLSPGGCPWDREQTNQSLAPYAIEEAHELAEALSSGNSELAKEELGDFLFQVVFHSALFKRQGKFELDDVVNAISTKLIRRHPHVFGDAKVSGSEEVLKNWDIIKNEEKKDKSKKTFDIPLALPALQRSQKIGSKTRNLKFDWKNAAEVFEKVTEEIGELKEAFDADDKLHAEEELGDVLFVLAQFARHYGLDAESCARKANIKFERRFDEMLKLASQAGKKFEDLSLVEKEDFWTKVKTNEP